jgi:hypothetical protein
MLKIGLATKQERSQPQPIQGLYYLLGLMADRCSIQTPEGQHFDWHSDRFVFEAFRLALSLVLDQIQPTKASLPEYLSNEQGISRVWRELLATPETWANHIFWGVWDEFAATQHLPAISPTANSPPFVYSWAKARAALNNRSNRHHAPRRSYRRD